MKAILLPGVKDPAPVEHVVAALFAGELVAAELEVEVARNVEGEHISALAAFAKIVFDSCLLKIFL